MTEEVPVEAVWPPESVATTRNDTDPTSANGPKVVDQVPPDLAMVR